jgi:probable HAF family extracellular repeat protein
MGKILKEVIGRSLVVVSLLLLAAAEGQSQTLDGSGNAAENYCVIQVGDLNKDGNGDFAVITRNRSEGIAAAYVFLDGRNKLPASFDETFLEQNASYVLRGSSAAPFTCPRTSQTVSTLRIRESVNNLSPAEAGTTLRQAVPVGTVSPIDRPTSYAVVDLNSPDSFTNILAKGLNSMGQVVGQARVANGESHAFFFDGSQLHDLGTLGGHSSIAYSINDSGEIVGNSLTGEIAQNGFVESAFRSDGFSIWSLGRIWSHAYDINDPGQIVGDLRSDSDSFHATLFENGGEKDLGTLTGANSFAFSINSAGQIVGESDTFITGTNHPSTRAFVYKNGTMSDLGAFGFFCTRPFEGSDEETCFEHSSATDINDREQIAGFSSTDDRGYQHAFLITGDVMQDLGTLGGSQSWAQAVNDSGQVVGSSLTADDVAYHAFLFDKGTMYDLNDLVTDVPENFFIWEALDINDFGQIVGLNYLLNPEYEKIASGEEFAFMDNLERELSFEFWLAEGAGQCPDSLASARIEVRIGGVFFNGPTPFALRSFLNRWLPASRFVRICAAAGEWQQATLTLPVSLEGRQATVTIRVTESGGSSGSPVFLRRFTTR